jgi:hypothetical protein
MPHFGQFPGRSVTTSGCIGQVYFCAGDGVGDTETLDDWIVWAKTALAAQIVAKIDDIRILFLILKLVEVEKGMRTPR